MNRIVRILALMLLLALALGVLAGCREEREYTYDYLSEDINGFIKLADKDYKGYTLTVKLAEITESLIDEQIMYTLYEYRSKEAKNPGKTAPLSIGDTLETWYRGYRLDSDGREIELDGLSNMTSGLPYKLDIGSASLPLGVESSLVGKIIADYPSLEDISRADGEVIAEGDIVYINYSLLSPEGKSTHIDVRVDLTRTDLDSVFGQGFRAAIVGKTLGEKGVLPSFTATGADGKYVYSDVKATRVYPKSAVHITAEARLPYDYEDYDLAGTKIYFDIFPHYFTAYDTPELDEKFITETLKLTAESLAEYKGDTLVARYRSSVRAALEASNEEQLRSIKEEAMWYHYNDVAEVIEYPEDAVLAIYSKDLEEIRLVWESCKEDYPDFDDFARAYLSLTADSDWEAKLKDDAKAEVKEKLIYYYIIKKENILPSDTEYRELYDKLFDKYVLYYMEEKTREDYSSDEEYAKAIAEAEEAVLDYYGDAFFRDQVYYDFAIDKILDFAVVEIVH